MTRFDTGVWFTQAWPEDGGKVERRRVVRTKRRGAGLFVVLTIGFGGLGCGHAAESGDLTRTLPSPLTLAPCEVESIEGNVECGVFTTRENPDDPESRLIEVPLMIARAIDAKVRVDDPIFLYEGGPGAAISASANEWVDVWSFERAHRDLVLIDYRGTGGRDALRCGYEGDPDALSTYIGQVFLAERYRKCHDELSGRYDLREYTTIRVVDDANAIREALGYKKINIVGGSYGSRLVIEHMRRHPETVRAAFLFGLTPADEDHMGNLAQNFEEVLESLAEDCRKEKACDEAYPSFLDDFYEIVRQLEDEPIVEMVKNGAGDMEEVTVEAREFAKIIRYMLYEMESARSIPFVVDSVKKGRYNDLLSSVAFINSRLNDLFADGMWASVTCAEDFRQLDQEAGLAAARQSVFGSWRLENEIEICEHWTTATLPSDFFEPVTSDIPLLMMVGGSDVATPSVVAETHIRYFPNGTLVVVPPAGHEVMPMNNPCLESITKDFFERPDRAALNTECVGGVTRPLFGHESPFAESPPSE